MFASYIEPGLLLWFRPAVLVLLVCSCSCTPTPAPHTFSRASSSEGGRGDAQAEKEGPGSVASASVPRASSFPTAFVRTRVGVKRKSLTGSENKAGAVGQVRGHWAVSSREDAAGGRLAPLALKPAARPLAASDGRSGGAGLCAAAKGAGEAVDTVADAGGRNAAAVSRPVGGEDPRTVRAPGARRFMLLRHGQTDFNAEGRVQGSSDDSRLSDYGLRQARGAGAFLSSFDFERTYVSPLNRAVETLRAASGEDGDAAVKDAVVDEDLREIDLYEWQGMLKEDIKRQFPDDFAKWRGSGASSFRLPSGNYPVVQLWARARKVWGRLLDEAGGGEEGGGGSLVVAHNAVIQAMICTAMGLGEDAFRKFQVPNCGVVEVEWVPGEASARRWRWRFPSEDAEWRVVGDYLDGGEGGDEGAKEEILGRASLRERSASLERSSSVDGISDFPS